MHLEWKQCNWSTNRVKMDCNPFSKPKSPYNMVHYSMVLDIALSSCDSQYIYNY